MHTLLNLALVPTSFASWDCSILRDVQPRALKDSLWILPHMELIAHLREGGKEGGREEGRKGGREGGRRGKESREGGKETG